MREIRPFSPTGKTIRLLSASSAPLGVQAPVLVTANQIEGCQFRIHNSGTIMATVAFGESAAEAQTNAAVPTDTSTNAYPMGASHTEIFTAPRNSYWSAISASNVSVYVTPGAGL